MGTGLRLHPESSFVQKYVQIVCKQVQYNEQDEQMKVLLQLKGKDMRACAVTRSVAMEREEKREGEIE